MTNYLNTAETGLASGTVVTTANTSTGAAGTGMTVSKSSAPTTPFIEFDATHTHRGSLAYRIGGDTSGDTARFDLNLGTSTASAAVSEYVFYEALPPVESVVLALRTGGTGGTGTSPGVHLSLTTAGRLRLYDNKGAAVWLSSQVFPAGQMHRFTLAATRGADSDTATDDGTLRAAGYSGANTETTIATDSYVDTTAATGAATFTQLRVTGAAPWEMWVDDIQWSDSSDALIGPVGSAGSPPGNVWTVQELRRINTSSTSGNPTSQTLTRVSGPAVTITQPTSGQFEVLITPPFTAPLVLRLVSTNTSGSDTDDFTVTPSSTSTAVESDWLVYDGTNWVLVD